MRTIFSLGLGVWNWTFCVFLFILVYFVFRYVFFFCLRKHKVYVWLKLFFLVINLKIWPWLSSTIFHAESSHIQSLKIWFFIWKLWSYLHLGVKTGKSAIRFCTCFVLDVCFHNFPKRISGICINESCVILCLFSGNIELVKIYELFFKIFTKNWTLIKVEILQFLKPLFFNLRYYFCLLIETYMLCFDH